MSHPRLSEGSLSAFLGQGQPIPQPTILQVVDIKDITKDDGKTRYRLTVSDGANYCIAVLPSQYNLMIANSRISMGTIIEVRDMLNQNVQSKSVVIIAEMEALQYCPPLISYLPGQSHPPLIHPRMGDDTIGSALPEQQRSLPNTKSSFNTSRDTPPQLPMQQHQRTGATQLGTGNASTILEMDPPRPSFSRRPAAHSSPTLSIVAIADLSPYAVAWMIKGRVSSKSGLVRFKTARGEGQLFSFDLTDKVGGEIRVTGFNGEATKFFGTVIVGSVYLVSKTGFQPKKPQFNLTNHAFELQLNTDSRVQLVEEDDDIPKLQYDFKPISDFSQMNAGSLVDCVGVVESVGKCQTYVKQGGMETSKRSLVICDDSTSSIELTIWGQMALDTGNKLQDLLEGGFSPVLSVKRARLGDFNGKTVGTISTTLLEVDPVNTPRVEELRAWYGAGGRGNGVTPLSLRANEGGGGGDRRCFLSAIRNENLGAGTKADFITVKARVISINHEKDIWYPACSLPFNNRPCNKKMVETRDNVWFCERCQQTLKPSWRYMLQFCAGDPTAMQWMMAFNEIGEAVLGGIKAEALRSIRASSEEEYLSVLEQASDVPAVQMKLRAATESYNGEERVKVSVVKITEVTDLTDWEITPYTTPLNDNVVDKGTSVGGSTSKVLRNLFVAQHQQGTTENGADCGTPLLTQHEKQPGQQLEWQQQQQYQPQQQYLGQQQQAFQQTTPQQQQQQQLQYPPTQQQNIPSNQYPPQQQQYLQQQQYPPQQQQAPQQSYMHQQQSNPPQYGQQYYQQPPQHLPTQQFQQQYQQQQLQPQQPGIFATAR